MGRFPNYFRHISKILPTSFRPELELELELEMVLEMEMESLRLLHRGHALCRTFRRFSTYRSSGIKSTEYRRSYSTSYEKRIRGSLSWRNWAGCVRGSSQTRPD